MLIPVGYHSKKWPLASPSIIEVAGHFDIATASAQGRYCLHTEYSAGPRRFDSPFLADHPLLAECHHRGVPLLWHDRHWALAFAGFIADATQSAPAPEVIEIHPPFVDYCPSFEAFSERYAVFQNALHKADIDSKVVIENRHGTRYTRGKFLLNRQEDLRQACRALDASGLPLALCLDVPQLFSAHFGPAPRTEDDIDRVLTPLMECRHRIASVHMWGKKRNKRGGMQAHYGTLDTWLGPELKRHLLRRLHELLDDDRTRYFVPEVNGSQSDMDALAKDMIEAGFTFC